MPFIPNTPESHSALLHSPPSLCRGVSNDGRPCKRALVRGPDNKPASGIITIIGKTEAYFCAKHQEQAKDTVLRHTASFARRRALVGRGSLDTLIEQVEVLVGGGSDGGGTVRTKVVSTTKKVPRNKDPFRPPPSDGDDDSEATTLKPDTPPPRPPSPPLGMKKPKKQPRKRSLLSRLLLCCCSTDLEEEMANMRISEKKTEAELRTAAAGVVDSSHPQQTAPRPKTKEHNVGFNTTPPTPPLPLTDPVRKAAPSAMKQYGAVPSLAPTGKTTVVGKGATPATPATPPYSDDEDEPHIKLIDPAPLSKIQQKALQLIPPTLPARAIAKLQQEVLKPFSAKDEPGYIYMFWLTTSPLSPYSTPASTPGARLLHGASTTTPGGTRPKLLLKIGRAANVQRRLHQWTTQCNYNLQLIRYYPHTSGSTTPNPVGRTVPNVHRIERLIHLELEAIPGSRPDVLCKACGKTHQEWFEVEGSREGVEGVDETIKRWIKFGEDYVGVDLGPVPKATLTAKEWRERYGGYTPAKPVSTPGKAAGQSTARQTRAPTVTTAPVTPTKPTPAKKSPAKGKEAEGSAERPKAGRQQAESNVKAYNRKSKQSSPDATPTKSKTTPKKATPRKSTPKKQTGKKTAGGSAGGSAGRSRRGASRQRYDGADGDSDGSEFWDDEYRPETPESGWSR